MLDFSTAEAFFQHKRHLASASQTETQPSGGLNGYVLPNTDQLKRIKLGCLPVLRSRDEKQ